MNKIDIEDLDLNNAYFHFTARENLPSIEREGLKAQVGDASKMVQDKPRVCLSKGGKGILGIKNSFIHEFKKLRICDIPEGYRKYFDIKDFSSTEIVDESVVYDALEKRFRDEIYLVVDAREGEDFLSEEIHGLGSAYDIKGKENHDIGASKIDRVETSRGDTALDVLQYIYNRILEKNLGKENLIKSMNSDLSRMLDFLKERDAKGASTEPSVSDTISPSQIGESAAKVGTGITDINRTTHEIRLDLQPVKEDVKEFDD